jgi:hypothetical protein|nr:hypothetical protein [Escherichia coli]WBW54793.1 hypothetical protein FLICCLCG_00004 [Escherichia coli]
MVPERKQAEGAQEKSRDDKKNPYGLFFVLSSLVHKDITPENMACESP